MELYFLAKWLTVVIVRSFFADVTVIGMNRVPMYGPVIFVGNHNNQFVDATMLLALLPRTVRFLIAEVSLSRAIVGPMAKQAGAIAVKRPQDNIFGGIGGIIGWQDVKQWIKNDANKLKLLAIRDKGQPLLRGICKTIISGDEKARFRLELKSHDRIKIPDLNLSFTVSEVIDDRTISVLEETPLRPTHKKTFKFQIIPKIDQTDTYAAITEALHEGQTIGIFPEGGSHDRPDLLPLKPGVAIMALNAAATGVEDVLIVPVGLHYFNPEKFASRASVDIGIPLPVPRDLVEMFKKGQRKEAVDQLMRKVKDALTDCIVAAPDLDTMACIKLCATLYPPERNQTSPDIEHHLYHLFSRLYRIFRDHPCTIRLNGKLLEYKSRLDLSGIPDTEVWELKQSAEQALRSIVEKLAVLCFHCLVGLAPAVLWGPMRAAASLFAERHRHKALMKSSVKIKGTDVIASYKIMILLFIFPLFNLIFGFAFACLFAKSTSGFVGWVVSSVILLPPIYYYSMRSFARITPMIRQIRALGRVVVGEINVWQESERELISSRMDMQLKVRQYVDQMLSLANEDAGIRAMCFRNNHHYDKNQSSDETSSTEGGGGGVNTSTTSPQQLASSAPSLGAGGLRHIRSEWNFSHHNGEGSDWLDRRHATKTDEELKNRGTKDEAKVIMTPVGLNKFSAAIATPGNDIMNSQDALIALEDKTCCHHYNSSTRLGESDHTMMPFLLKALTEQERAALLEIKSEFDRMFPAVVLDADTRRLLRLEANYGSSVVRTFLESREEIL